MYVFAKPEFRHQNNPYKKKKRGHIAYRGLLGNIIISWSTFQLESLWVCLIKIIVIAQLKVIRIIVNKTFI